MLFKRLVVDERVRNSVGKWSMPWLGITQLMLLGVLLYRLYVVGQPDEQLTDFRIVLAVSVLGAFGLHLYLGGILPVPTWKGALLSYAILVVVVAAIGIGVHGVPAANEWATTWLPGLAGPAIFVSLYWFTARLGERRVERMMAGPE